MSETDPAEAHALGATGALRATRLRADADRESPCALRLGQDERRRQDFEQAPMRVTRPVRAGLRRNIAS
ncbi:hypothetical protein [Roseateles amylovorans]|uniref:Uncharacterized protein n=1 Tax=Roseateles amylovorans TaxID=2978473 RepID=A0ABY6AY90_9BURK|nr:hypothetical protein [Roseateles amylovorans]UXH78149.1 hypothetical protein N4261_24885 [Roseateles amylovorans]